jgi:GxxExxY protein
MVEELTKKIIRAAFAVHNYFGYGFSERVYQNSLVFELDDAGLEVSSEHVVSATYKNRIVGNYRIDILVEKIRGSRTKNWRLSSTAHQPSPQLLEMHGL